MRRPTLLTPEALAVLQARIKTPPAEGGLWTGPKIARRRARFHGTQGVHDQRGWDALIAIGYSIQQPRPRHPEAAGATARGTLKKTPARRGRGAAPPSASDGRALENGRAPHRPDADHAQRVGACRRAAECAGPSSLRVARCERVRGAG